MQMEYELVHTEPSEPQQYPMTDMKVGDWAVIVGEKSRSSTAFNAALFGCVVMKLHEDQNYVFTDTGQCYVTGTNYTVRNFKHGECLKIRRA